MGYVNRGRDLYQPLKWWQVLLTLGAGAVFICAYTLGSIGFINSVAVTLSK